MESGVKHALNNKNLEYWSSLAVLIFVRILDKVDFNEPLLYKTKSRGHFRDLFIEGPLY